MKLFKKLLVALLCLVTLLSTSVIAFAESDESKCPDNHYKTVTLATEPIGATLKGIGSSKNTGISISEEDAEHYNVDYCLYSVDNPDVCVAHGQEIKYNRKLKSGRYFYVVELTCPDDSSHNQKITSDTFYLDFQSTAVVVATYIGLGIMTIGAFIGSIPLGIYALIITIVEFIIGLFK